MRSPVITFANLPLSNRGGLVLSALAGLLLSTSLLAQEPVPIRYNADELVEIAVLGQISPPALRADERD